MLSQLLRRRWCSL